MPDSVRPTITQEHHDRYAQIMGTPTNSAVSAPPAPPSMDQDSNSPHSSIPKPKGLGNKMFIFTGKKKIIMEGTQRQSEDIKTVEKVEAKPKAELASPGEVKSQEKKHPKKGVSKKVIIGAVSFLVVYTLFWLFFLGYINF